MKFGKVVDSSGIDFTLPETKRETIALLQGTKGNQVFQLYVGCARWGRADLKGFYPRGTKDDLQYYSEQFNAIEFNTTFYHLPSKEQVISWSERTVDGFKFFPKLPQSISHYSRLLNTDEKVLQFVDTTALFEDKLGMAFLQLREDFKPKLFERLFHFLHHFPKGFPLAVEVRNEAWFNADISADYFQLLQDTHMTNMIVDTPGRRDILHMRLTTPTAFIRFVATNTAVDFERLDAWVAVIKYWRSIGLSNCYFFIHQPMEKETAFLASYFVKQLNELLDLQLPIAQKV
ncbi:DUF72 domain-containing protein [Sphingobacterium sp. HJSM2_6]|uniref:DUF72 domain-containing protein n=1 Tax=Sphingobacterium sp. HJSM2_6 TaxID=3366264 RepID=UPI003BD65692